MAEFRVVVLGGYGHFGAHICRALAAENGFALVVAGRSEAAARTLVESLPGAATRHRAAVVDVHAPGLAQALRNAHADLVIHTSGPFQSQGYAVARACIQAGCDYVDLADGRDFVAGIAALDDAARLHGRVLVSGASTVPGISSAVVSAHLPRFRRLDSIRIGIAPGQKTPRGTATVAAVLSYCGRAFTQWQDGEWAIRHGWQHLMRWRHPVLGWRLWGACDVPDLVLLPARWPSLRTVSFHAALELPVMQLGLWLAAWAHRLRLVRDWSRHAAGLKRATDCLDRFGSDDGGMFVRMDGLGQDGSTLRLDWWLTARRGHGPFIPCVPAIVLARRLAAGDRPPPGAHVCVELVTLDEFTRAVEHLDIAWQTHERA